MAKQKPKEEQQAPKKYDYITKITVAGFKSIAEEQSVEIRPLTILAGANSSGFLCEVAKKGTKLLWLPLSNRLRTTNTTLRICPTTNTFYKRALRMFDATKSTFTRGGVGLLYTETREIVGRNIRYS